MYNDCVVKKKEPQMTEYDLAGFLLGCAIGFDMDSDEIESVLAEQGLSTAKNTLLECQHALHLHVGQERFQNGLKAIRSRMSETNSDKN